MLYVRKKNILWDAGFLKQKSLLRKKKFIFKYKHTNTICSNTQIHFEMRPKYNLNLGEKWKKKIKNFEKKWTIWTWLITVELIKNY